MNEGSEETQMDMLRVFIRRLESIDGVEQELSQKVLSPPITPDENSRDLMLDSDRASEILTHQEKYEYASIERVAIVLLWHTMIRVGGVHALDVDDSDPDEQSVKVRYRPETGTPIKNQGEGERKVSLSDQICDLLADWLATQRHSSDRRIRPRTAPGFEAGTNEQDDASGLRLPLDASLSVHNEWSHDRDLGECSAIERDTAYRCPSSVSPHAIRRGSITHSLNSDTPDKVVSDRANVSQRVIEQH